MSDTTIVPDSTPVNTPAPASNEVVIDQNPHSAPHPVGSQAPEKVQIKDTGAEGRRNSIQKAFDRANDRSLGKQPVAERPKAKPAEAKMGHNEPPEETERLDLKKRPSDQPRGNRGQFAPRSDPAGAQASESAAEQSPKPQGRTLPAHEPYAAPPPRMAEHAKADWASTPEKVRGEVYRMHEEFNKAYEAYRGDHEAMQPIRHYHQMAQQHGTTLDRALSNYVSMEQKLRSDVVGGLDIIVNNLGMKDANGNPISLRDVAYHILSQTPEQEKLVQQSNQSNALGYQIGQLSQMVQSLAQNQQHMQYREQFTHTRSAVDQYADSHPRFDELGDLIENELKLGFDLDTAYRRAELLRPAAHAPQTRNPSPQTRTADRSISGSPDAGPSNGTSRRSKEPVDRRTSIQNAIRRVNGAL